MRARSTPVGSPRTSGGLRVAQGILIRPSCHRPSRGSRRTATGSYSPPEAGRLWKTYSRVRAPSFRLASHWIWSSPTSPVMASTEFGTGNRPRMSRPASARRLCTRSPTAHTWGRPAMEPRVLRAKSTTISLNCPTRPWSVPKTIAVIPGASFRCAGSGGGGPAWAARKVAPSPAATAR